MIMHRVKDAVQIDVGHLKPLFWRKLVNVLFRTDDSGIIERKMQSAERLFGKIDGRFCIIGIGTFALKGAAFPPFCFNSSAKSRRFIQVDIGNDDSRSTFNKQFDNFGADA